ncbi:Small nuclear ribonucleoprotein E [Macleaya cordata]|uniref:Small nuclear ribonucleoprotein E n=1 Tax=Macleaya cordata TaxID=56857 RepID=A0A200QG22_MACCD|nr:Small nuclear ribonucleoprotein E [Macleaya cordata]
MATTRVQRIMTQPINLIFRFLQSKARIQIWLFEQKDLRIEGRIIVTISLAYWNMSYHDFRKESIERKIQGFVPVCHQIGDYRKMIPILLEANTSQLRGVDEDINASEYKVHQRRKKAYIAEEFMCALHM